MDRNDALEQQAWVRRIGQTTILSPSEFSAVHARWQARGSVGDDLCRQMVGSNLRLVFSVACRYRGLGLSFDDLMGEGLHGVMTALHRYDRNKGARFSTMAVNWIRSAITHALNHSERFPVHLSPKVRSNLFVVARVIQMFESAHGREPTDEELHAIVHTHDGTDKEKQLYRNMMRPDIALARRVRADQFYSLQDALVGEGLNDDLPPNAQTFADRTRDTATEADIHRELMVRRTFAKRVLKIYQTWEPRDQAIFRLRIAYDGKKPWTLREIGDRFHVSRERIRQLQQILMRKLADALGMPRGRILTRLMELEKLEVVDGSAVSFRLEMDPPLPKRLHAPDHHELFKLLCEHVVEMPDGRQIVREPARTLTSRLSLLMREAEESLVRMRRDRLIIGSPPWSTVMLRRKIVPPRFGLKREKVRRLCPPEQRAAKQVYRKC